MMGQTKNPITVSAARFKTTATKTRLVDFFGAAAGAGVAAAAVVVAVAGAGADFGRMGLGFGALE